MCVPMSLIASAPGSETLPSGGLQLPKWYIQKLLHKPSIVSVSGPTTVCDKRPQSFDTAMSTVKQSFSLAALYLCSTVPCHAHDITATAQPQYSQHPLMPWPQK